MRTRPSFYSFLFLVTASCFTAFSSATAADRFTSVGTEKCFLPNTGGLIYHVVSPTPYPAVQTDGQLTVHYKGVSPYGPSRWNLEIETAPNVWESVAYTGESKTQWQTASFRLSKDILERTVRDNRILRFRHGNVYVGGEGNCVRVDLSYNDSSVFSCPIGQTDFGGKCRPTHGVFNEELLSSAACSSETAEFTFTAAPTASKDGTLSFDYLVCEGGSAELQLFTPLRGWLTIDTTATANSCSYTGTSFTVPQALMTLSAISRLQFRIQLKDNCRPGMGCSFENDPCARRAKLSYAY